MEKSTVKKNFFYQVIYDILSMILPFVTSPYIARVIGAQGLGIYSYSYSVAYYFYLFSMLGLKNYGNRAIAQCRDNKEEIASIFSNIVAIHIIVSLLSCAIYIGYIFTLKEDKLYAIIMFGQVLGGLFDISWFYFGIEKFKLTVIRNTIIKVINVAGVFIFVRTSNDLWKYCLIMSLGMLMSQMVLWVPLKKYTQLVKPQWSKMVLHIKPMLILFIPSIAVSLYKYMDKIMIGAISSKEQLGFYENAEKVINMPITVIVSFGTVMLPRMSNMIAKKDRQEADKYTEKSMLYVMWLAYALTFGLMGVGSVFAPIFWGKEFELSGYLIMGLAITIPFMSFANVIRTQYLIPTGKDTAYMSSVVGGAVINLIVNWFLIPQFGSIGATVGTIVAEILVCVIQCSVVKNELPLWQYFKDSFGFLLMGMLMFFVVYYIGINKGISIYTLFIQIFIGVILYGILSGAYFYKIKEATFMDFTKKALRRIKKY